MPRPCATLCRGRPWWHKVPWHKVTRHKVTRHKVLAQGCRHKALAPSHEHISWPRTKFMKTMTAHAFHMILMPAALFPPIPETMKMMTVPGISCDSEANRSRRRAGGRGKGEGGWRSMDILVFSKAFPDRIPRIICFFNSTAIVGTRSAQGSAQGLKGQSRAGGPLLAHFEVSQLLFGGTGGLCSSCEYEGTGRSGKPYIGSKHTDFNSFLARWGVMGIPSASPKSLKTA